MKVTTNISSQLCEIKKNPICEFWYSSILKFVVKLILWYLKITVNIAVITVLKKEV